LGGLDFNFIKDFSSFKKWVKDCPKDSFEGAAPRIDLFQGKRSIGKGCQNPQTKITRKELNKNDKRSFKRI
jgi:hypothetical protein